MSPPDIRVAGLRNVEHTRSVSRDLIEKAMEMRCTSYLSQVKSGLLLETIFEVDKSRKLVRKSNQQLEQRVAAQTRDLRESNQQLEQEVEEHLHTEEQLRQLAQAVEHAGEGMLITDTRGKVEYVNPAFCRMMGYAADEVLGNTPTLLKSGEQDSTYYQKLWATITSGQVWNDCIIDKKKDGSLIPVMMSIAPIFDRTGTIISYVATQQDMSKQKELEEQFQQAQKMDALGTLVGGIAHDFNNMLAAMIGNVYLVKCALPDASQVVREHLDGVDTLAFHASAMIKQLLAFARKGSISKASVPLTALMKEAFKLQQVSVPENIRLELCCCADELQVYADATQLQQVFINLVNNARDAVELVKDPSIHVQLKIFCADAGFLARHKALKASRFACLSVCDNGCGIAEGELEKVFDPFFTSKEVGKGTGLGLAMVFGTISSHDGVIEVESKLDEGTTFHVYLPLSDCDDVSMEQAQPGEVALGRGETILLVDDNAQVRHSCEQVLCSLDYTVLIAVDGLDAVEIYSEKHAEIDLIILDLVMPRMGGAEAAKAIVQRFPDAKIIFATAYDSCGELASEMAAKHPLLEKPFAVPQLSQMIREQLNRIE